MLYLPEHTYWKLLLIVIKTTCLSTHTTNANCVNHSCRIKCKCVFDSFSLTIAVVILILRPPVPTSTAHTEKRNSPASPHTPPTQTMTFTQSIIETILNLLPLISRCHLHVAAFKHRTALSWCSEINRFWSVSSLTSPLIVCTVSVLNPPKPPPSPSDYGPVLNRRNYAITKSSI